MKRYASIRAVLLVGAFLPWVPACRATDPAPPATSPSSAPLTVKVVHAKRGPISRSIQLPATVLPHEQAVLYAKVAGYLKTIRVDKGDFVHAGDLLAEIESPELAADLARQKAELGVAELAYRRASDAQKKAPDLVMPQTVDDAKGRMEVAQATLQRTETLLGYTRILAPLSGIVTRRSVDPGAFIPAATSGSVAQSSALLTLMDISSVRIDVPVPEPEVPLVKVGLPLEVTADELAGVVFRGSIGRFAYALDEAAKTMTAEAEISNPERRLRPGMYVRARIAIEKRDSALLVPLAAVLAGKGQDFVFAAVDGKAKRLPVRAGFRDDASVEIIEGLSPDQAVILSGPNPPNDGQPVTVAEGR